MKTKLSLVVLFCISQYTANSQNWQMVKSSQLPYFSHQYRDGPNNLSSLYTLKVDSTLVNSSLDSTYYFTNFGFSNGENYQCIPKKGGSILGEKCTINSDGDTYFSNNIGDSILIKTQALLNETWVLGTNDTMIFTAKIAAVAQINLNNTLVDSIKIITLTNNTNGALHPSYYIDTIVISKNNGILKMGTLHAYIGKAMYGFGRSYFLLQTNGMENIDMVEDIFWKYKPGNVFQMNMGNSTVFTPNNVVITDSIIAVQNYGNDLVIYFQRQGKVLKDPSIKFVAGLSNGWSSGPGIITENGFRWLDTLVIDTITSYSNTVTLRDISYPYKMVVNNNNGSFYVGITWQKQMAALVCDSLLFFNRTIKNINASSNDSTNCYQELIPVVPVTATTLDSIITICVSKFGDLQIEDLQGMGNGIYRYFKINGCEFGERELVFPLAITNVKNNVTPLQVFPNPCNASLNLNLKNMFATNAVLINMLGQSINLPISNNSINTQNIASGIYTLQIKDSNKLLQAKLLIQH